MNSHKTFDHIIIWSNENLGPLMKNHDQFIRNKRKHNHSLHTPLYEDVLGRIRI